MTYSDPRKDGFNYGIGWGSAPLPKIYRRAARLALVLGIKATKAGDAAWEMQMATRAVRLAETDDEKRKAIADLERLVSRYRRRK